MFIYLIVNHETEKYYVGQHKGENLKQYLQKKLWDAKRKRNGNSCLYNSMRKHPFPHLWSIHALRSDIQNKTELDETERDFIRFLRSQDPEYGYNICRGGEGHTGPNSPEARIKISAALQKFYGSPDSQGIRQETSVRFKRLWANPEYKSKVSELVRQGSFGKHHTPETCEKIRKIRTGTHHKEESKEKQRQNMLHSEMTGVKVMQQMWANPEMKRIMVEKRNNLESYSNRHYSSEARIKIGEASKRMWANPENRKSILGTLATATLGLKWIHRGDEKRRINTTEVGAYLCAGWILGQGNRKPPNKNNLLRN